MAWIKSAGQHEPDIDPFNAPDPIMPGMGDPVQDADADGRDPSDSNGMEHVIQRNIRKEPSHKSHRPQQHERAPEAEEDPSPAPSKPGRVPTLSAKRGGKLGFIIAIAVLALLFSGAISSIGSCASGIFDDFSDGPNDYVRDYDGAYEHDETRDAVEDAADETCIELAGDTLDRAIAGEEPALGTIAPIVADDFESWVGLSPNALGIDPEDIARTLLASTSYSITDSYAWADSSEDGYDLECSVYYYLYSPDITEAYSRLSSLIDRNYPDMDGDGRIAPETQQHLANEFNRYLGEAKTGEIYLYFDMTGTSDPTGRDIELLLDEDLWESDLTHIA